jgi:hypothetical protein
VQKGNDQNGKDLLRLGIFEIDRDAQPEQDEAYDYNGGIEDQRGPFEAEQIAAKAVGYVLIENDFEFLGVAGILAQPVAASLIKIVSCGRIVLFGFGGRCLAGDLASNKLMHFCFRLGGEGVVAVPHHRDTRKTPHPLNDAWLNCTTASTRHVG